MPQLIGDCTGFPRTWELVEQDLQTVIDVFDVDKNGQVSRAEMETSYTKIGWHPLVAVIATERISQHFDYGDIAPVLHINVPRCLSTTAETRASAVVTV